MNSNDLKERIIESLNEETVIHIMSTLGAYSPIIDNQREYIIFNTICHNISHGKHKLYFYLDSKTFHCYTNCGNLSIFDIVMNRLSIGFAESVEYLAKILNISKRNYKDSFGFKSQEGVYRIDDWDFISRYYIRSERYKKVELPEYDDVIMDLFTKEYHLSWINDGISINSMKKYNIKYYLRQNKIIIPHYDIDNRLIGIRGRALNEEDIEAGRKYMPLYIGDKAFAHPLSCNLYGLSINKETIVKRKKIMLVESEKGVLQSDTMYEKDNFVVALSSSNLTDYQVKLILSLGVEEVIFALDKQFRTCEGEEYDDWVKKIKKNIKRIVPYVRVYLLWDTEGLLGYKDSPTDKGQKVLETLMRNKIEVKTEDIVS